MSSVCPVFFQHFSASVDERESVIFGADIKKAEVV